MQNLSELSDITLNNPHSFTITNDSNVLSNPVHNVTQNTNNDPNQKKTNTNLDQDNSSTLSTTNTTITQPFQTEQPSPRNSDPTSIPSQYVIVLLIVHLHSPSS